MIPLDTPPNTLVDYPRLSVIVDYLKLTNFFEGDVAEVGVYRGGTAKLLCANTEKHVFLFDTFTGMPDVGAQDLHKKGDFNDTSIQYVSALLAPYTNYSIYKGIFPEVNSEYVEFRTFSFVHLDVDIYQSVMECLKFFGPRMEKGGIIVLDDYNEPNCPGAKLATDEYCARKRLHLLETIQSQAAIVF